MVQYKQKSLIPDTIADKAVNANKRWNTIADKKLNTATDKTINADKGQNATAVPLIQIKD